MMLVVMLMWPSRPSVEISLEAVLDVPLRLRRLEAGDVEADCVLWTARLVHDGLAWSVVR